MFYYLDNIAVVIGENELKEILNNKDCVLKSTLKMEKYNDFFFFFLDRINLKMIKNETKRTVYQKLMSYQ